MIDNLTLTLNGNQLNRVDDAVTASAYNGGFEFKTVPMLPMSTLMMPTAI